MAGVYVRRGVTSNSVMCDYLVAGGYIEYDIARSSQLYQSRDAMVRAKSLEPEIYTTEERAQAGLEEHVDRMDLVYLRAMGRHDYSAAIRASESKAKACGADLAPPIKFVPVVVEDPMDWEALPKELHRAFVEAVCLGDHPDAVAMKEALDGRADAVN